MTILNQTQKDLIVGSLLGDAYLETTTKGKTWRLGIEHGDKQKIYVFKKYEILQTLSSKMQRPRLKITKKGYRGYSFWTPRLDCLKQFGDAFYQKYNKDNTLSFVKVIPNQFEEWLTPQAFAFWYMDDGSMKSKAHKLVYLNTQGFTLQDNKLICQVLTRKYGLYTDIKVSFNKRTKKYYNQVSIHGSSLEVLRQIIEPFMYSQVKVLPVPSKRLLASL